MTEQEYVKKESLARHIENSFGEISTPFVVREIRQFPATDVVPKSQYDLAVAEREANVKGFTAEVAELQSEIKVLKDSNMNLQELYQTEREKVAKAKEKVFEIGRALQSARAEIERLQSMNQAKLDMIHDIMIHDIRAELETARSEAIKEFAERLKAELTTGAAVMRVSTLDIINNLVKEMTGDAGKEDST